MNLPTPKDPAELIATDGIDAYHGHVNGAKPIEEYLAQVFKDRLAQTNSVQEGEAEITLAVEALADLNVGTRGWLFWDDYSKAFDQHPWLSNVDIDSTRKAADRQYQADSALDELKDIVASVVAEADKAKKKQIINDLLLDEARIDSFAVIEAVDPGVLDTHLDVARVHGLGKTLDALSKRLKHRAKYLRQCWEAQGHTVLKHMSDVVLAEVLVSSLRDEGRRHVLSTGSHFYIYPCDGGDWWSTVSATRLMQLVQDMDGVRYEVKTKQGKELRRWQHSTRQAKSVVETALAHSSVHIEAPFSDASTGTTFQDGVLVWSGGALDISSHDPKHYHRTGYPFEWSSTKHAPRFLRALKQWFWGEHDAPDKIRCLLEFFGVCLLGRATHFQKALMLYGKGGTGKSVILKIMQKIFPVGSVSMLDPQLMQPGNYEVADLNGKLLNIAYDIPSRELLDTSTLKKVITGDPLTARRIYGHPFDFVPIAGHAFAANELPRSSDMTNALFDRMLVVEFPHVFRNDPDRCDPQLVDYILEHELQGVVRLVLEHAERALQRRQYTVPPSSRELVDEWSTHNDSVKTWLKQSRPSLHFNNGRLTDG